jgi:hypothetical protein
VLPTPDEDKDDIGELEELLVGAFVELGNDIAVDEGATWFETSTGHTSASTPPIVSTVQLLKGAFGKPAKA